VSAVRNPLPALLLSALLVPAILPAPAPAAEAVLIATRAIRGGTVILPGDVALAPGTVPGALGDPGLAVGLEARVTLYPGRPILAGQVGPPALVARNQAVTLVYRSAGLEIVALGRALDRGGPGERVRAMNLDSRLVVSGRVAGPGLVEVTP
jgi:flagella basal body P-ring formation protein FlgA